MSPSEIRLERGRTHLSVTWVDGSRTVFAAALLRKKARDAASVRSEVNGWAVPVAPDISISAVEPIGNYAIRLVFSDGHERGIFPWAYLSDIAAQSLRAQPAEAAE